MKRNIIVGLAAALVLCLTLVAWKASGGNPGVGIISTVNTARFMLFGGSYNISAGQTESGVFKIDSYTGDTWLLKVESSNGKRSEKWVPVQPQALPQSPDNDNQTTRIPPGE